MHKENIEVKHMEVKQCGQGECSGVLWFSCEHGDYCADCFLAHVATDPVCNERWFQYMADIVRLTSKLAELNNKHWPLRCDPFSGIERVHELFLGILNRSYEAAGLPHGVGDEGLWRWIEDPERHYPLDIWQQ